jgi:ubiquinone/menaquinone biosynthesis C-methylase UbiE
VFNYLKYSLRRKVSFIVSRLLGSFVYEKSLNLPGQKLDLGCGPAKLPGHIGIDKIPVERVDVICDVEKNYLPFRDECFDVVYSSNTLEHIENIEEVLSEVWRILRKNGHFLIQVPYFGSPKAFQDPNHVRYFTLNTLDYFVEEQDVAPKWYYKRLFKKIVKKRYIFIRTPINLIIGPIINSSSSIQRWFENSIFRVISPEAIEVDIVK